MNKMISEVDKENRLVHRSIVEAFREETWMDGQTEEGI